MPQAARNFRGQHVTSAIAIDQESPSSAGLFRNETVNDRSGSDSHRQLVPIGRLYATPTLKSAA